jgi:Flp pilus assembly pilin Flp
MTRWPLKELIRDEGGAALVEYAIIAALLSLVGMAGFAAMTTHASSVLNNQQTGFDTVQTSP